jgi:predicted nucleic acid-binding protein
MYLLDTNVVSELRRARPHGAVLEWLKGEDDKDLHLSAVTLGEIQAGIEITRAQDRHRAEEIEAWADAVADSWNILQVDASIYRRWARLMHGQSDHLYEDALIAATALQHDLTVVTRNMADFEEFGVRLLNPFEGKA